MCIVCKTTLCLGEERVPCPFGLLLVMRWQRIVVRANGLQRRTFGPQPAGACHRDPRNALVQRGAKQLSAEEMLPENCRRFAYGRYGLFSGRRGAIRHRRAIENECLIGCSDERQYQ